MEKRMIKDIVQDLSDIVNSISVDESLIADEMVEALVRTHRTLQTDIIEIMILTIVKMAGTSCDGRNKAAIDACQYIKTFLEKGCYLSNDKLNFPYV